MFGSSSATTQSNQATLSNQGISYTRALLTAPGAPKSSQTLCPTTKPNSCVSTSARGLRRRCGVLSVAMFTIRGKSKDHPEPIPQEPEEDGRSVQMLNILGEPSLCVPMWNIGSASSSISLAKVAGAARQQPPDVKIASSIGPLPIREASNPAAAELAAGGSGKVATSWSPTMRSTTCSGDDEQFRARLPGIAPRGPTRNCECTISGGCPACLCGKASSGKLEVVDPCI
mmetsp:Transcript_86504/g.225723  ORF Transcript_86504/g.225723 Transcript_86504/m.225723 type:complete len:229 (+) Transcript_86504:61-747(+)